MNRIRELRELAGLTQEQLGKMVGTTKNHISRLEKGPERNGTRLTVQWMQKIAAALKCSPADLLDLAAIAGATEDEVELVTTLPRNIATALASKGLSVYKVTASAVERAGINPDDDITVDQTEPAIAAIKSGDVVLAAVSNSKTALVLRQFLAPDMIVTNRIGSNVTLDLSEKVKIVGVVIRAP